MVVGHFCPLSAVLIVFFFSLWYLLFFLSSQLCFFSSWKRNTCIYIQVFSSCGTLIHGFPFFPLGFLLPWVWDILFPLSLLFSLGLGFGKAGSRFSFSLLNAHNLRVCLMHLFLRIMGLFLSFLSIFVGMLKASTWVILQNPLLVGFFCHCSSWAFSTRVGPMTCTSW